MQRVFLLISLLVMIAAAGPSAAGEPASIGRTELTGLPPRILLTLHRPTGDDLALYDWANDTLTDVVTARAHDSHGTWSPDGTQIAFQTNRDGDWEIYVRDMATGEERNITHDPGSQMYPNWTPDGQVIHMSDAAGQPDIWRTDPRNGESMGITAGDGCGPDYHPNVSAGFLLAYRGDCLGSGDIWLRLGGIDNHLNLTPDAPSTERYPAWSPDGTALLMVSDRTGDEDIYRVDLVDGMAPTNLTNHPARDAQASWSPDGRYILFISDRAGHGDDLYIMDADGGRPTRLLNAAVDLDWPWWELPLPLPEEGP